MSQAWCKVVSKKPGAVHEFEFKSSGFKAHGHNPKECDIIICWDHDWPDCPIEVLELHEIIKTLPQEPIERPGHGGGEEYSIDEHLKNARPEVRSLFKEFDSKVKEISEDIWVKPYQRGVTYYSPERVFIYLSFQKQGLRLNLFTRGKDLKGVDRSWKVKGAKWGRIFIRQKKDIAPAITICRESYKLIKEAIKVNEPTGWHAEVEEEEE
jgi:predicted transport protein